MNTTVIITVLNEAETIGVLLEALLVQTRPADEIVLVDGGSTDGTASIAREYERRLPGLRVLEAPGTNISQGRNRGIEMTRNAIIAVTDAGCRPSPDWLAQIVAPLEADSMVGMVSGIVQPDPANHFEACVGLCSLAHRMKVGNTAFFPTARSLAFHRELWAAVAGFPEELDFGEDTAFIIAATATDAHLQVEHAAIVYWRPRRSYGQVIRQFYHYAEGLARAGLGHAFHQRTIAQSTGGAACLLLGLASRHWLPWALLALLAGMYLARKARRGCFAAPGWRTYYRVPLILFVIHVGTMAGIVHGHWQRLRQAK